MCNNSLVREIKAGNRFVRFGKYFINNNQTKEPIEWRVLKVSNNKALLITKEAIDFMPYDDELIDTTWDECTLRQWLNNEFINEAFTKEEQDEILVTNVSNPDNLGFGIKNRNKTQDKIFLLSIDEVKKYFKNDKDRECKATKYAKEYGMSLSDESKYKGNCYWWLRSLGFDQDLATVVCYDGNIFCQGDNVFDDNAVRPVLFINLK